MHTENSKDSASGDVDAGEADALWSEAFAALESHRLWRRPDGTKVLDSDAQTTLNRIAAKCMSGGPGSFDRSTCEIRRESYRGAELLRLTRCHRRGNPKRLSGPIVVVEWEGQAHVIDGNNRVKHWITTGDQAAHSAVVITPREHDARNDTAS